ncbi:HU family DNA-binding protein [Rhodovulum euryhalinum]|uniref:DNA-binding protein HU-beta n=1 Tax=Rhodovulum euryhalinum TaxID=35805 RepID=A0A4V2SA39_9RHOB|nr:HU family DNA-binding protein [Rhodovulum euryhalinum]TCO69900.1 DNA-binding protein HU-beta [Rhodovulum euryhalinum]
MAKPMTKTQLVAALAEEMGADKKTASAALDAVTSIITREVAAGGSVTLPGVGKIYCRERPERMVRNPATGEQFKKPSDKVVKMTIAKALKDSVNG